MLTREPSEAYKIIVECMSVMSNNEELEHIAEAARSFQTRTGEETDEEIAQRLADNFEILAMLTDSCLVGECRALIASGPAGCGKSWTVEQRIGDADPEGKAFRISKGYMKATGLFRLFYKYRLPGQVLVFDDTDTIFFDETSLNMLKTVCDTTEHRRVTWGSEMVFIDEDTGEVLPKRFEYEGGIIFLTNYDFDEMIAKGHKLAPHLAALMSRAHYIDLRMKTKRDHLIRIKQVVKQGMLGKLTEVERQDVLEFIVKHQDRLRETSLRIAIKIANLRRAQPDVWEKLARVTCLKQV